MLTGPEPQGSNGAPRWLRENLPLILAVIGWIWTMAVQSGRVDDNTRRVTAVEAAMQSEVRDQDSAMRTHVAKEADDRLTLTERMSRVEAGVGFLVEREKGRPSA
jgi:hypothetical protein